MKRIMLLLAFVVSVLAAKAAGDIRYESGVWYEITDKSTTTWKAKVIKPTSGDSYKGDIEIKGSFKAYQDPVYFDVQVTAIDEYAFQGAKHLTSVTLPAVSYYLDIPDNAFNGCSELQAFKGGKLDYYHGSTVDGVLYRSSNMLKRYPLARPHSEFTAPNGTSFVSPYAFQGCENLETITLPNQTRSIGHHAFQDCDNLASMELPQQYLKSIEEGTFQNCDALYKLNLPYGIEKIGKEAFAYCDRLHEIYMGGKLTSVEASSAFDGCSMLTTIFVREDPNYCSQDGVLFNKDATSLLRYPEGKEGDYRIPSTVNTIGEYAFMSCEHLKTIEMPSTVNEILTGAFNDCFNLTNFRMPSSVTTIGHGAFSGCSSLTEMEIPNSVTEIGEKAFYYCSGLVKLTLPSSAPKIGGEAFEGCDALKAIYNYDDNISTSDYKVSMYIFGALYASVVSNATLYVTSNVDVELLKYLKKETLDCPVVWAYFKNIKNMEEGDTDERCLTPYFSLENGKLVFYPVTPYSEVLVKYSMDTPKIVWDDARSGYVMERPTEYKVAAYAKCDGYKDSDVIYITVKTHGPDMNGDGKVTVADITDIVDKYILKGEE